MASLVVTRQPLRCSIAITSSQSCCTPEYLAISEHAGVVPEGPMEVRPVNIRCHGHNHRSDRVGVVELLCWPTRSDVRKPILHRASLPVDHVLV